MPGPAGNHPERFTVCDCIAKRPARLEPFWGVAASRNISMPARLAGSVPVFVVMAKLMPTLNVPPCATVCDDGVAVKSTVAQADCASRTARLSATNIVVFFIMMLSIGFSSSFVSGGKA